MIRREAFALGLVFGVAYGGLALTFCHQTPRLFAHLDQIFDADLGLWTIDLARPQGPHARTRVHPLSVLFLNPLGFGLRELLRQADLAFAARLAAGLLSATAGGAAVGVFRVLLHRLGVAASRARLWTLAFALSASHIVFSSVPESFSFSALSLLVVFTVATGAGTSERGRTIVGVVSFGITVTNLVAVVLARASAFDWRREARRAAVATGRHVALILLLAAALSLVQRALYPTTRLFFQPDPLAAAYDRSFIRSLGPAALVSRTEELGSHVLFVGLAAPRTRVNEGPEARVSIDFPPLPLRGPRPASAAHALLWTPLLVLGVRGLVRSEGARRGVPLALLLWLGFQAVLHFVFGTSLFLYSAHWVFALLAVTAVGLESEASRGSGRARLLSIVIVVLAGLQAAANLSLVREILRVFSGPR